MGNSGGGVGGGVGILGDGRGWVGYRGGLGGWGGAEGRYGSSDLVSGGRDDAAPIAEQCPCMMLSPLRTAWVWLFLMSIAQHENHTLTNY